MSVSINQMIRAMHKARHEIEINQIGGLSAELAGIFDRAERKLYRERDKFFKGLSTNAQGEIIGSVKNIEEARKRIAYVKKRVDELVKKPGMVWGDKMVNAMGEAGRELARVNLTTDFVPQAKIDAVFKHVSSTERAILRVGRSDAHSIIGTIGDDINEFFRREMLDSVAEGIPVQGRGDSLANRLFASGRLKAIPVYTKDGRTIMRSARTRADAIARVESAKILNATHEDVTKQALGDEAVYRNSNPRDSRTTDICSQASRQEPMTLLEWSRSRFGRPPRLRPFHLCRSVLIGGMPEWFDDDGNPEPVQDATKPPQPDNPEIKGPQDFDDIKERIDYYAEGDNIVRDVVSEAARRKRKWRGLNKEHKRLTKAQEEIALRMNDVPQGPRKTVDDAREWARLDREFVALHERKKDIFDQMNDLDDGMRDYAAKIIGNNDQILVDGLPIQYTTRESWKYGGNPFNRASLNNLLGKRSNFWSDVKERLKSGRDFVNRLVHHGEHVDDPIDYDLAVSDRSKLKKTTARAFHRQYSTPIQEGDSAKTGVVLLDKGTGINTVAHEYGHLIEENITGVREACRRFLSYRTRGETPTQMKKLFPTYNYDSNEVGRKDKFEEVWERYFKEKWQLGRSDRELGVDQLQRRTEWSLNRAYYNGKKYDHPSTEILSMGLEMLYLDPVTFARVDPEYFKFIVGVLRGDLRYY